MSEGRGESGEGKRDNGGEWSERVQASERVCGADRVSS